jgi:Family of unknown function (DUF6345)
MAKQVGVEWIDTYDCLNPLTHEHEDAPGFYNELVQHDGWIGSFNWGNSNAWEEDFKRTSKGGTAPAWADAVDFPDDNLVECDGYSGPSNGDLRLGSGDLEWLALEVCNTLQLDATLGATNLDVFDRWADAFQGLHTIVSFTTVSLDVRTPGSYFGAFCDGRWPTVIFGLPEWLVPRMPFKVIDAWFAMTSMVQPAPYEAAALYANTQGTDTQNDYIWDHGHVSPDPVPGTASWFSWTWVPHAC